MPHDIIDNRREKLLEHILRILSTTERARFAVGYLFLSGLKPIREHLEQLKELRLLIGNTTDSQTLETLAEGYRRLDPVQDVVEGWRYQKRVDARRAAQGTAENLRAAISLMDQTDEDEETVRTVLRLVQAKRLKVRVYAKERLHAKAYIFDYGPVYDLFGEQLPREEKGIAVVGSSNLTLAGISHNTELNVLVDESHNFRYPDTQRYGILQGFLATGRRCLFLTATPRNKSAWDIYHQIKLFHPDDRTDLPVAPPNLRRFFRNVENGDSRLQDLLVHILIRRTRGHILRFHGYDAETDQRVDPSRFDEYRSGQRRAYILVGGKRQFFPERNLETVTYSIEETYRGLYEKLRRYLGRPGRRQLFPFPDELTYARYGLWHYVRAEKRRERPYAELHQAGANLRGLMRVMLFKRFESSVHAFRETLKRLLRIHKAFLKALKEGIVPAGEEAQDLLYESDQMEETQLLDALRRVTGRYNVQGFHADTLRQHIQQDIDMLEEMLRLIQPITPQADAKLQRLKSILDRPPLAEGKRLIFTQYADTAQYLYDNLNPDGRYEDMEVIYSGDKSRGRVVGRFAPKANPWYRLRPGEVELNTVITTDVLAEGLNLQDCDKVINYDLHWNPVRLIQRLGRIDRIGSEHDRVFSYNFLPEIGIERQLGLREKLEARIREIHETIGEDAAILDPGEKLNQEAMYAIYTGEGRRLGPFEDEEEPMTLNEAEELLRLMREEDPEEYERIADLRDGIRTGRASPLMGLYAFFAAGRYQQLMILDKEGNLLSDDLSDVLNAIACGPEEPSEELPSGYNAKLMQAKRQFDEDVKQRRAQRKGSGSLTVGQRYALRGFRLLFNATNDDDRRADIASLEQVFRAPLTTPVTRELNRLRRHGIAGQDLFGALQRIYFQYNLKDIVSRVQVTAEEEMPRIVCSEALV